MPTVRQGVDMASRLDDTYQGTGDDYKDPSYLMLSLKKLRKLMV